MGKVIRFHARASTGSADDGSSFRAAISAKTSSVISDFPRSAAKATTAAQCGAGMPLVCQPLTVEADCPRAGATSPVPPRVAMTDFQVNMPANIVRTLRTSQAFATRETTIPVDCGSLSPMIDPPEIIGPRLKALRLALECPTQTVFAKKLGIEKNTYNPFEKGTRELTFETACLIRKRFKIPLDYLFWGDMEDQLPAAVSRRLSRAA